MENRFENCQVLWGKRYRGKFTGIVRYAEAVVKGFEKEWRKLKRKYGISSKYSDEIWDALDVGNEQKVRVMVGNALDELNGFAGKLVRAEIKTEYWRAKKEKILEDVRELIEYYEGILEGDGDGDSEDR